MQIVFEPPDKNAPGFLRRMKKAVAFQTAIREQKITPETVEGMVDFLVDYVTQPTDRNEAKEALWEASQAQFSQLLEVIGGGGNNETKDPLPTGP